MRRIIILGASGSIGTQTIEICAEHGDEISIVGVAVGKNKTYLRQLLNEMPDIRYAYAIEYDEKLIADFPEVVFYWGENGLLELLDNKDYDLLVNALVGFVGLKPTLKAIKEHKDIALANKETLVAAGDIVMDEAKKANVKIIPIDSEHSAIFQCLAGSNREDVKRLIITASGGAFRDWPYEALKDVKIEDALKHPVWQMGSKITIDSATMMNKGYEIIEAHHLFGMPYDKIVPVIHYESIIHSAVEYKDGSLIAQLSHPDMRLPIEYALFYPRHLKRKSYSYLDLAKVGQLNFKEVDFIRYKLVKAACLAGQLGGNMGAILNGANDTAVNLFLCGKIAFTDIEKMVLKALNKIPYIADPTVDDIFDSHDKAVDYVNYLSNRL